MDENLILVMPFAYLVSFYLALIDQLLIIATWLISIFFTLNVSVHFCMLDLPSGNNMGYRLIQSNNSF